MATPSQELEVFLAVHAAGDFLISDPHGVVNTVPKRVFLLLTGSLTGSHAHILPSTRGICAPFLPRRT